MESTMTQGLTQAKFLSGMLIKTLPLGDPALQGGEEKRARSAQFEHFLDIRSKVR